jgi:hypothetical protein
MFPGIAERKFPCSCLPVWRKNARKGSAYVEGQKTIQEAGIMGVRSVSAAFAAWAVLAAGVAVLTEGRADAHCDSTGGPVITEAKAALEKGDVTPLLKWVKKENEEEIRSVFAKAVAVRSKGAEAKALADQYFLETLVRVHRAGEGAPFTGLKDDPVEPIIAMADKAIIAGSADEMTGEITGHAAAAIKEKFNKVLETRKNKDKSVEAGREFVEAYVTFMHYVEGIHEAVESRAGHGEAEAAGTAAAEHKSHKE